MQTTRAARGTAPPSPSAGSCAAGGASAAHRPQSCRTPGGRWAVHWSARGACGERRGGRAHRGKGLQSVPAMVAVPPKCTSRLGPPGNAAQHSTPPHPEREPQETVRPGEDRPWPDRCEAGPWDHSGQGEVRRHRRPLESQNLPPPALRSTKKPRILSQGTQWISVGVLAGRQSWKGSRQPMQVRCMGRPHSAHAHFPPPLGKTGNLVRVPEPS